MYLSKFLISGELNLDSICGNLLVTKLISINLILVVFFKGNSTTLDFTSTLTSILEIFGQYKEILQKYVKTVNILRHENFY